MLDRNKNNRRPVKSRDEEMSGLMMEEQNDELATELDEKVIALKNGVIDLRHFIQKDVSRLNDIQESMSDASGFLNGTMNKFTDMMKTGGTKTTCYLAGFIFLVIIILWWIVSSKY